MIQYWDYYNELDWVALLMTDPPPLKVEHLQPFYMCLSILGCSLGELQVVRPDKFGLA